MFVLGLTGSIATGKSTALEIFAQSGAKIYSADAAVHDLYQGDAVAPVEKAFPGVTVNGQIDRQKLGQILVADPIRLQELEAIVHPLVHRQMIAFLDDAQKTDTELAVLEIPLLFETAKKYPVDAVAVTICSDEEQRRRALARKGMTVEKLESILARQMSQADKKQRADFVINTDHGIDDTTKQIALIIAECRKRIRPNT